MRWKYGSGVVRRRALELNKPALAEQNTESDLERWQDINH